MLMMLCFGGADAHNADAVPRGRPPECCCALDALMLMMLSQAPCTRPPDAHDAILRMP